ncbi:tigger transposable element-derived protein 6 [Trichonephila clavipes]|nr:tigger transposable element-derived protein 6 [Trichonephila clavipes]
MSSRHHIDDFTRGRIIGKIEGRKITDVARKFDIAHSVVSRLWKSFKTTRMCSRRQGGGRVRNESRFSLSSDCRRQLIWHESGTAYRPENIQEKDQYPTCSIMVWAGIMINGRTRLHLVANGTMTGQRYIDEVLLPHVRLFRGADALGRQVDGRNYPPTNKNTLIRALTEAWDKLPQQLLDNVVQRKSAKPRCFKGINWFPTKYRSNKKAWMTTELFNEWLVSLKSDMKREKRRILLFVDNCTVHISAPPLSNVKLQFFPPNSTSKLQTLDQGIIHNFKTVYRREVVKSVSDNLENQHNVTTISILTVFIMIDKAWRAVTRLTIHSCFQKSGFPSPNLVDVDDTLIEFNSETSLWEAVPEQDLTFDDYVLVDTDIAVWGALYDAEIGSLNHNNTESDEEESEELTPVTLSEVKESLNKLRNFFLQNHLDAAILQASFVQEKSIDKVGLNAAKQKKRT